MSTNDVLRPDSLTLRALLIAARQLNRRSLRGLSMRTLAWWRSPRGHRGGELVHVGVADLLVGEAGGDQLGDQAGDQLADLSGQVAAVLADPLVL